jgi:MerR family redox-sensitive transcriptional activator SoxR
LHQAVGHRCVDDRCVGHAHSFVVVSHHPATSSALEVKEVLTQAGGMTNDELSIGEVAARSGVAVSAIRHYESLGLLVSTRTAGNQRRFPRTVLRRIAVIHAAQRVGLSLAEVGEAFDRFPADHAPTKREWAQLAREWRPLLERKIHELEQVRIGLSACIGCGCLSMRQCSIYNPDDELGRSGSGARRLFPRWDE